MSTSIAIAASSTAIVSAAASNAADAKCMALMPTYQPTHATVEEMHAYADCVYRLHPNDLEHGEVLVLKVWIVVVLLGTVGGFLIGWRKGDTFLSTIIGCVVGVIGVPTIIGVFSAIKFLFTA